MERSIAQQGFTLIETILYIALASAVSIVLVQAIGVLQDIRTRHLVAAAVNDDVSWAMDRIAGRIVAAALDAPLPGTSGDQLVFTDGWSIVVENGSFIERTSTVSHRLTAGDILVSSVSFHNMGASQSDIVRMTFTAAYRTGASASAPFMYQRNYETSITPGQ